MFQRSTLLWRFFCSHMAVMVLALIFSAYFAVNEFRELQFVTTSESLKQQAEFIGEILASKFEDGDTRDIAALCERLSAKTLYRITALAPDGTVLGDSQSYPARMENHSNRPEIKMAMAGLIGNSVRYSFTLNRNMVYVAVPVKKDGKLLGLVRTSTPTENLSQVLQGFYSKLGAIILLLMVCAALVSLVLANRITSPITNIKEAAAEIARGQLDQKVVSGG
ncbi:MAG: hypothetical protein ACP5U1_13625, partial [Desulfomonilaceae bacterium]